ncbi:MAG: GAF domain-containing protein [Elusimicrobia bacterium]|nr:GAF domain-containing protein [Candidatus Liberimonas magnetica]
MSLTIEKFKYLLEANQKLSSTLDLPGLLRHIMKLATDMVEAETSSILLYDRKNDELVFDLALTEKESRLKEVRLKIGEGIAGWVAKEKKSKIANNLPGESHWTAKTDDKIDFKTRSILAVPLLYKEVLLGVVEAINKKNGEFIPEDAAVLEAFAAQAAVSIENAKLFANLTEEKEKIEAMFSQMSDGAIFFAVNGQKLLVNQKADNLIGLENTGKRYILDIFADFTVTPSISEILKSDQKSTSAEFLRSIGKPLYLSGTFNKIMDHNGNMNGILLVFNDVTVERKETMLKRDFISLVSHKLRTPLVAIIGYCPLLLQDKNLNDFHKKAVSSIQRQGNHLARLVDKLINFTLIENDSLNLLKMVYSFKLVAEKAVSNLKEYIEQESADVTINEDVGLMPDLKMDADKIEAVIRNLTENAIKFNGKADKKVEVKAYENAGFFGLAIKDNGPGIPSEERTKIFDKFYQIEENFTGQVEGAGLGLNFVKKIIEAHGGKVGVDSQIGNGSTFYFLLPKE